MITNGFQAFALVFLIAAPSGIFVAWLDEKLTGHIENMVKSRREIEIQIVKDEAFFNLFSLTSLN